MPHLALMLSRLTNLSHFQNLKSRSSSSIFLHKLHSSQVYWSYISKQLERWYISWFKIIALQIHVTELASLGWLKPLRASRRIGLQFGLNNFMKWESSLKCWVSIEMKRDCLLKPWELCEVFSVFVWFVLFVSTWGYGAHSRSWLVTFLNLRVCLLLS